MRAAVAAFALAAAVAAGAQPTFDPTVVALLQAIETSGCQMERNGVLHDGKAAADHLRMKLERSGRPGMFARSVTCAGLIA